MRVWVISSSLPPFNDSSTLQLISRVQAFAEHNIDTVFVGMEVPNVTDSSLLHRLPRNSTVYRTKPAAYDHTMAWLSRVPGGKVLSWAYANAMFRIAAPDNRVGWDRQVVQLCTHLPGDLRPDAIVSHSGSYTAHIAGRHLAQRFRVPWIADLGDPWSLVDPVSWTFAAKARRNRMLELHTIPYASGLVLTTNETLAAYQAWMNDRLPRAIALPCYGYEPTDFLASDLKEQPLDNRITMSHIGAAHQNDRNLIPTIRALGSLEHERALRHDFSLKIIGPHSRSFETEAQRAKLRSAFFSGRVSYRESVDWIKRSSVLLIVGNKSPLQIPGKVYPCLGSGRPILYLGQLPQAQDPAARLLTQFPGTLFARNSQNSIKSALQKIDSHYSELCQESISRLDVPDLHGYESSFISSQFSEFVKGIANASVLPGN